MAKKPKSEVGPAPESSGVNLDEIERLLTFMQSHALEELEYQRGDLHVRLKKASAVPASFSRPGGVESQRPVQQPSAPVAPPLPPSAAARAQAENVHTIKSPIVGTFYASPSPESDPFVTTGARVDAGQVLCIIEAMKLMNEIESDVAGEVVRIHVENGKPVEYGAPLFDIRNSSPAKK
jgi:acetyl-CoA carboxylase biotin carboxyl carrier protein